MIEFLTGKAAPYIGFAVLILFLSMLSAIYALWERNTHLAASVGALETERDALLNVVKASTEEVVGLRRELRNRDTVVTQAIRARQLAERHADKIREELADALATDECANTAHPDAVGHSLRAIANGRAVQDSVPVPARGSDSAD